MLNDRLRVLVAEGILDRVQYQDHPARYEYRLTAKGADLYPVLVSLMAWGTSTRTTFRRCGWSIAAAGTRPSHG